MVYIHVYAAVVLLVYYSVTFFVNTFLLAKQEIFWGRHFLWLCTVICNATMYFIVSEINSFKGWQLPIPKFTTLSFSAVESNVR